MLQFNGKVAIVTGSGGGLGRTYALLLAKRGAKVIVNDVGQKAADAVVNEIKKNGGTAVADYNSVVDGHKVVETAILHYNRIDIVVNNAGILRDTSFAKMKKEQWDAIMAVHLKGTFAVTHAAWPFMLQQKYGRIVLVSSTSGIYGNFGQSNYSAAKTAMLGFGKSLAKEGAKKNIKVNILVPGAGSQMTASVMPPDLVEKWKPEYVAPTVAYLCHEDVPCSGAIIESGGGWCAQVKYIRSPGVFFDITDGKIPTVEDVAAKWKDICSFEKADDPEKEQLHPSLQQIMNPSKL